MPSKTLIVCPHMHLPGGIAGYYQSLQGYLKNSFEFFHTLEKRTASIFSNQSWRDKGIEVNIKCD
ncbi:MAG: hypothetical protein WC799_12100 [Desulfobacteraceae bacterium]|jgi:hypothetical protein